MLVDSLLLKLLANSLHKRQTSLVMSFVTFYIQLLPGLRVKTVKVTKKWGVQMGGIIRGGKKTRRYCTLSSLAKALNLMIF